MNTNQISIAVVAVALSISIPAAIVNTQAKKPIGATSFKVVHTDAEWKKMLSPEGYNVLRHAGTERPYTGKTWDNHVAGNYYCAGCDLELFSSKTKFESGTGWPSFYEPIRKGAVLQQDDNTFGDHRIEILCSRCGGHLGHVFNDGPKPTGLRYCMNSAALVFKKAK